MAVLNSVRFADTEKKRDPGSISVVDKIANALRALGVDLQIAYNSRRLIHVMHGLRQTIAGLEARNGVRPNRWQSLTNAALLVMPVSGAVAVTLRL